METSVQTTYTVDTKVGGSSNIGLTHGYGYDQVEIEKIIFQGSNYRLLSPYELSRLLDPSQKSKSTNGQNGQTCISICMSKTESINALKTLSRNSGTEGDGVMSSKLKYSVDGTIIYSHIPLTGQIGRTPITERKM